eukprot:TRINITY_DN2529_c0_g1_i4.p1 TRINITY_DN2529_c0_g1~~TRINITY_DN2529_c0_g1_i4.p1  ORF type:complete len:602 (+),score=36.53 TRINITY_DN2529_c0_g1_i4:109-1914(+)
MAAKECLNTMVAECRTLEQVARVIAMTTPKRPARMALPRHSQLEEVVADKILNTRPKLGDAGLSECLGACNIQHDTPLPVALKVAQVRKQYTTSIEEQEGSFMEKYFLREFRNLTFRDLPIVIHCYCLVRYKPIVLLNRALSSVCEAHHFTLAEARNILETYAFHKYPNMPAVLCAFGPILVSKTGSSSDWRAVIQIYVDAEHPKQTEIAGMLRQALSSDAGEITAGEINFFLKQCVSVRYTPPEGHWLWKTPSPLISYNRSVSAEIIESLVGMQKYTLAVMLFSRLQQHTAVPVAMISSVLKLPRNVQNSKEMELIIANMIQKIDPERLSLKQVGQVALIHLIISKRPRAVFLRRVLELLKTSPNITNNHLSYLARLVFDEVVVLDKDWGWAPLSRFLHKMLTLDGVTQIRPIIEDPDRFKYKVCCNNASGLVLISWGLIASGNTDKGVELLMECETSVEQFCEVKLEYLVGIFKATRIRKAVDFIFDCIDMSLARSGLRNTSFPMLTRILAHAISCNLTMLDHFIFLLAEHIASISTLPLTDVQIAWILWSSAKVTNARSLFRVCLQHPRVKKLLHRGGTFTKQVDQACARAGFTLASC